MPIICMKLVLEEKRTSQMCRLIDQNVDFNQTKFGVVIHCCSLSVRWLSYLQQRSFIPRPCCVCVSVCVSYVVSNPRHSVSLSHH